ncbi:probable chitinase 10 [Periplaneta americana]|uniref:probable chitinase 10 n=1 Tax=Periplaneta americana TaxID=6978 RepID=UPI0037E9296A
MEGYGFGFALLLTLLLKDATCVPNYVTCPDSDPVDHVVFFPHENNCTEFYRCDHGSPLVQLCPSGLHWNAKMDTCDWPWSAGCSPSTEEPNVCEGGEDDSCPTATPPQCPAEDPTYSLFFPHPSDCHWFFHCSNGVAYCKACPSGLHWNPTLNTCDWPWHAGCKPSDGNGNGNGNDGDGNGNDGDGNNNGNENPPSGSCPVPQPPYNVYFPDPYNCGAFYQCSHGVPYHQNCPAGLHFNPSINVCDYPENAGCSASGGKVTTEAPAEKCPDAEVPVCPITDPDVSVYFPHPSDSHWFYHCSHGIAYCKICPAGLRWNQEQEKCDW